MLGSYGIVLEHKHALAVGHFLIGANGNYWSLVVFHSEDGAFRSIGGHLYAAKEFLHLSFDAVFIDVTYYHNALQIGTIPCFIVVAKRLVGEIVHHIHDTDRQTVAIAAVRIHYWQQFFHHTLLRRHLAAPLFVDYATLGIYFFLIEQEVVGPIVQNQQARVLHTFASGRYTRDVVNSALYACVSIKVVTKLNTHAFAPLHQIVAGKTLGAIEAHVFEEVCQSTLIVFFHYRTHFLSNVEFSLSFRIIVVTDIIGQSVRQLSNSHLWIYRYLGAFLCHYRHSYCTHQYQKCNSEKSVHRVVFIVINNVIICCESINSQK